MKISKFRGFIIAIKHKIQCQKQRYDCMHCKYGILLNDSEGMYEYACGYLKEMISDSCK